MQSILRPLLSLSLTITFSHHLIGSMNQQTKALTVFDEIPEIRKAILFDLFPHSFNETDNPKIIRDHIMSMSLVNKELNTYINSHKTTQTIIDHISNHRGQDYFANRIATTEMINYFKKSNLLYKKVRSMGPRRIKTLLEDGADINYFPQWKSPLLFRSLNHYNKTKVLLNQGANPNVIYRGKTALQLMIEKNNFYMSQLILSFNPHNKCLPVATFFQNPRIITCILAHQNIPQSELNEALGVALQKDNEEITKALVRAGAQFDVCFAAIKNKFITITGINV